MEKLRNWPQKKLQRMCLKNRPQYKKNTIYIYIYIYIYVILEKQRRALISITMERLCFITHLTPFHPFLFPTALLYVTNQFG